jgi:SpoIID/LytB domain protein
MKEPLINVGIISNKKIKLGFYGDFVSNQNNKTYSGLYKAEINGNKIIISDKSSKVEFDDNLIFSPLDKVNEYFTIKDVVIGVQFHWERKEKQNFKGSLKLVIENNELTAINQVPIEEYLTSVISSEMSAKCSLELLKAHAVISRSWLLAQIEKSKSIQTKHLDYQKSFNSEVERIRWYDREDHKLFDVCADDHCQRYQGITKIFTDIAKQAVADTKGLVLSYKDEICDTRFYKACGGITESFENVWEDKHFAYLSPVIDYKFEPDNFNLNFSEESNARNWILSNPHAYCNTSDKKVLTQILPDFDQETTDFYRWKVEYSQQELAELIKEKSGIDFGEIIDLVPISRGASSRLYKMKIIGTFKTLIIGKELEIRKILSKSHLYSSAIIIEKENVLNNIPQKFIIHGAGWGHGVGLCQIGAAVMAEKGFCFDEILAHYYKDSKLKKIY